MTAPVFELTSQRQKVSRLQTEPPGRPVVCMCQLDARAFMPTRQQEYCDSSMIAKFSEFGVNGAEFSGIRAHFFIFCF